MGANKSVNTVGGHSVRITDMNDEIRGLVPAWGKLPKVTSVEGCVFMVNPTRAAARGGPCPTGFQAFAERLKQVLDTGHFTGRLAPMMSMPLAALTPGENRVLMSAYIRSDKTMEQLNELLGEEFFTPEGSMGKEL